MLTAISKRNSLVRCFRASQAQFLRHVRFRAVAATALVALALAASSCSRSLPTDALGSATARAPASSVDAAPAHAPASSVDAAPASAPASSVDVAPPSPLPASSLPAFPLPARPVDGPHSLALAPGRSVFYALPGVGDGGSTKPGAPPTRLVGHLHGICHPPAYSCGKWIEAAVAVGALVCPTGNARCGDASLGPPSWEAPTWSELVRIMDADLEQSIAKVVARHPGAIRREGAVLTGWSRGAFAAPVIARAHPNRWPFLVLIEANVPLSAASLRQAGVRAVALLAGELGTEIAGERRTVQALEEAGFPARLFVMRGVAHLYPDDVDRLMGEALAFVLSHEHDRADGGGDSAVDADAAR